MIPLVFSNTGKRNVIKRIDGKPELKQHLQDMGFVVGALITVVSSINGNLIVNVKDTKVALDKQMAMKIFV